MTSTDVSMVMSVGSIIGLVMACLIGLLFVVSCLASVVKAFRDRREMKARIAARRAGYVNGVNGDSPSVKTTGSAGTRSDRVRPNILIIHDGKREERLKGNSAASPSSPPTSPDVGSPAEQTSHLTESTTVADVSPQVQVSNDSTMSDIVSPSPGSLQDSSSISMQDTSNIIVAEISFQYLNSSNDSSSSDSMEGLQDAVINHSGNCTLPGPISHVYEEEIGVDISGDVIRYSGNPSLPRSGHPRGIVQTFPGSPGNDGESAKRAGGDRVADGSRGKKQGHQNCSRSSLKHVAEGDDSRRGGRGSTEDARCAKDTPSPTFYGFAKNKKVSPRHHVVPGTVEHGVYSVSYNPRRNSYAAAISSDPDWMDRATVRRHSVEARAPVASASRSRSRDDARIRSQCRNGADNPAYNAADDRIDM